MIHESAFAVGLRNVECTADMNPQIHLQQMIKDHSNDESGMILKNAATLNAQR